MCAHTETCWLEPFVDLVSVSPTAAERMAVTLQKLWLHGKVGAGFYNAGTGGITHEFKAALADHGLRAFMGDDASQQPGSLWEMMLHETAVSWIRRGLTWTLPPRPWEETPTEFARRLRAVVEDINARHRVEGLCRELPQRVRALHAAQGGRLDK